MLGMGMGIVSAGRGNHELKYLWQRGREPTTWREREKIPRLSDQEGDKGGKRWPQLLLQGLVGLVRMLPCTPGSYRSHIYLQYQ